VDRLLRSARTEKPGELAAEPRGVLLRLTVMGARAAAATGLVVLLLAGCGQGTGSVLAGGGSAQDDGTTVDCGGSVYEADSLDDAPPASSLPDGPAGAVNDLGEPAFDPELGWSVVHQDGDRVDLLRELDAPFDNGGGDIRTHESISLERITGSSNVPDGTWFLTSAGPCAQRVLGSSGLEAADVTLATEPVPAARTLELLVRERECASGQDAEGRIEVVLQETAEQVLLLVGVRPPGGGQTCQGNPATPFTVELAEPLGARELLDASVLPARPITVAASE